MLLEGGRGGVVVFMKVEEWFGKGGVIEWWGLEEGGKEGVVIGGGNEGGNIVGGCFEGRGIEVVIEREVGDFGEECFVKVGVGRMVLGWEELK